MQALAVEVETLPMDNPLAALADVAVLTVGPLRATRPGKQRRFVIRRRRRERPRDQTLHEFAQLVNDWTSADVPAFALRAFMSTAHAPQTRCVTQSTVTALSRT